jgi:hypothetical protein
MTVKDIERVHNHCEGLLVKKRMAVVANLSLASKTEQWLVELVPSGRSGGPDSLPGIAALRWQSQHRCHLNQQHQPRGSYDGSEQS